MIIIFPESNISRIKQYKPSGKYNKTSEFSGNKYSDINNYFWEGI